MRWRYASRSDRAWAVVVRQLLIEGLVLACIGAALGLFVAGQGITLLRTAAPQFHQLADVQINVRIVAFTLTLAVVTTGPFSLAPALHATRVDLAGRLAHGGRGVTGPRHGLQRALVVAQVTLAVVLLTGAGLVVRSFDRLQHVSPGFSAANVVAFRISAQWSERPEAVGARQARTLSAVCEPFRESARWHSGSVLPAAATFTPEQIQIVEQPAAAQRFSEMRAVSADYFRVLQVPVLQGRTCRDDPAQLRSSEILVNRTFTERFFSPGNVSPISQHLIIGSASNARPAQIVGVVGDVRERGLASEAAPMACMSAA